MENEIEMKKVDIPVETSTPKKVETVSTGESPVMENTNELELKISPKEGENKEETVGTMNSFGVIMNVESNP